MIRSFGDSSFPVAYAGQTSWQRPHSVQDIVSRIPFHVRSETVPAPKRRLVVGAVEAQRLQPASRTRAGEEDVRPGGGDVQVLRIGQEDEEGKDEEHVRPDEDALERLGRASVGEEVGERVRHRRPLLGPRVLAERDLARMPEEERRHDPGDEPEDEVGLAEVAALEPLRPLHLADPERGGDADEDEAAEEVDEERKPALPLEPAERRASREARVGIDDVDDRDEDRGEEHDEAPEDQRVHDPRHEPLQELALAEDDDGFVLDPLRQLVEALERRAHADEAPEEERAPCEDRQRDGRDRREGERGQGGGYWPRTFLSSAEIAGTTSCRSPMTA